jgi:ribosomal protein S18 acetylase RimI-like enzyme
MEIRALGPGDDDAVVAASALFDGPAKADATRSFLHDDRHHLLIAYDVDQPVGFVSGVEVTHPDKGTEMFLYELAVEDEHQRRGIGSALVRRLGDIAKERGCYGMWVITDDTNTAALATYQSAGGEPERDQVVLVWTF